MMLVMLHVQGAVTRDATYLQNGTPIGPRDILQARSIRHCSHLLLAS